MQRPGAQQSLVTDTRHELGREQMQQQRRMGSEDPRSGNLPRRVRAGLLGAALLLAAAPAQSASLLTVNGGYGTPVPNTTSDDGSSALMNFPDIFPYGLNFFYPAGSVPPQGFYVNINGNISFGAGFRSWTPTGFGTQTTKMVAAYWTDLDTRGCGTIYYATDLAQRRVIITWLEVGYYSYGCDNKVTFQIILTDKSTRLAGDFDVELRYSDCSTGYTYSSPEAGYDAGDMVHFSRIDGALSNSSLFCSNSNAGQAGVWKFQISSGAVAQCGNGVKEQGEECDDGNVTANDGCSADCRREVDTDGDGKVDPVDNCPTVANSNQANTDGDLLGNVCDPCPSDPGNDSDSDGICYASDNCRTTYNPTQSDVDGDGVGDACDGMDDSPPTMGNDSYTLDQDTILTVAAKGVLLNDASVHALSAAVVTAPTYGTLTLNANGGFTYNPGTFVGTTSFTYRATDATNGKSGTATVTLVVRSVNVAPIVDAGANKTVNEGQSVSFSGSNTDPRAGQTWTYTWNWGDGTANTTGTLTPTHTFAQQGTYTVRLTVRDNGGLEGTDTLTVTVNNVAPTITSPTTTQRNINEGSALDLTITFSDPGNDTYTVTVTWASGVTSTVSVAAGAGTKTATTSRVYTNQGTHAASVAVSDGTTTTTVNFNVVVANVAPTVTNPGNKTITEGTTQSITASYSDPGTDSTTITFNWGDTTSTQVTKAAAAGSQSASASHLYDKFGTYNASIVVSDGTTSTTQSFTVTVTNVAPTIAAITRKTVAEGTSLAISTTFTDPGANTHTATINWGDSSTTTLNLAAGARTVSSSHTWAGNKADNSDYVVTLSIADGATTSSITFNVGVSNVAPTVTNPGNKSLNEGSTLSLTASFSDPGNDAHTVTFDWGGSEGTSTVNVAAGAGSKSASSSHVYKQQGSYAASVTVADGTTSTTVSFTVTVSNVGPTLSDIGTINGTEGATFTLPMNINDPGLDAQTVTIVWGDGTANTVINRAAAAGAQSFSSTHTYVDNADYAGSVTVSDGTTSVTKAFTAKIANVAPSFEAGAARTINEGGSVSVSFTVTDSGLANEVYTASVDWGDGTVESGLPISAVTRSFSRSHTYKDNRATAYPVSISVTDGDGGTGTDGFSVTVNNVAPTLSVAGASTTVNEGAVYTLSGVTYADVGVLDTHTAKVNWGCGTADVDATVNASAKTITASRTYTDNTACTVTVKVTDKDGALTSSSFTLTINNVSPTVTLTSNQPINEGSSLSLTVAVSDPGLANEVYTASVDWGDGSTVQTGILIDAATRSKVLTHTYVDSKSTAYVVSVTVTDGDGGSGSKTHNVTVNNVAPVVEAGANQTVVEGQTVYLTGVTITDPALTHDVYAATIDWGDGTGTVAGTVTQATRKVDGSHVYQDNGAYTVKVTVTDGDGGTGQDTFTVTVNNALPVAEAGADKSVNEGTTVSLNPATFTDNGVLDTHTATIDWGDGTGTQAGTVDQAADTISGSHVYADDGVYTVTVTV
jgi:cysteine-rich repeat protein